MSDDDYANMVRPSQVTMDAMFAPALHPPSVVAAAKAAKVEMAMDDGWQDQSAWMRKSLNGAYLEGQVFLGYPTLAAMSQRAEYRIIVETISTEMTRKWIEIKSVSGDETQDSHLKNEKSTKIKEILDEMDRLQVRQAFETAAQHDGHFGRGHVYLDTGDTEDRDELRTDLGDGENMLSIWKSGKQKPLLALRAVEPVWVYPSNYNSTDPLSPRWFKPDAWLVNGKEVHRSRFLTFIGRPVSDMLKPAYSFGGLSLTQMAKPYVDNWLRTRQSVSDLVHAFSTTVLKTNMEAVLDGDGSDADLIKRTKMFAKMRDNHGVMLLDMNTEDFGVVSTPLSGLDRLQSQSQEQICAVSRIPLVKYTGISPSGLNASSEGELEVWDDFIHSYQEHLFRANLNTVFNFVQLSLYGSVDPDLKCEFLPLSELTEVEKAQVQQVKAQTGSVLIQEGVVAPIEERRRLVDDPDGDYNSLDPDALPPPPAQPGMGPPPGEQDPWASVIKQLGSTMKPKQQHPLIQAFAHDEFNASEPRKEDGEWTDGGASATPLKGSQGHPMLISTRNVTGKKAEENSNESYLRPDLEAFHKDPEKEAAAVKLFTNKLNYPGLKPAEMKGGVQKQERAIINRMKDNIRALYDHMTPEERGSWKGWYEGANAVALRAAKKYKLDLASAAGVYAALSPQNRWDNNVYQGDHLLDIIKNHANDAWDDKMTELVDGWSGKKTAWEGGKAAANLAARAKLFDAIKGKTYAELAHPLEKAWWVRAYDETHGDRTMPQVEIGGALGDPIKKKDGAPATGMWLSARSIANAIGCAESGGDRAKISSALGDQHKVRSFYNNILDPASDNDDVTCDTHAIGAAWLRGLGGLTATPVVQGLASSMTRKMIDKTPGYEAAPSSVVTGIKGTYPLYAEAYRELAHELGIKPRSLQSIAWEEKIKLFKNLPDKDRRAVDDVWKKFHDDPKMPLAAAHRQVFEILDARHADADAPEAEEPEEVEAA